MRQQNAKLKWAKQSKNWQSAKFYCSEIKLIYSTYLLYGLSFLMGKPLPMTLVSRWATCTATCLSASSSNLQYSAWIKHVLSINIIIVYSIISPILFTLRSFISPQIQTSDQFNHSLLKREESRGVETVCPLGHGHLREPVQESLKTPKMLIR